jgi:hypothetical protein
MHNLQCSKRVACRLVGMALLVMGSVAARADDTQAGRERVYRQDRQVCLSGQSNQDQATCLREAGAARQQNMARQSPSNAAQLEANAVQRCDAFTGDARQSCLARMQGKVYGSVAAGGILRELTEPVP